MFEVGYSKTITVVGEPLKKVADVSPQTGTPAQSNV